MALCVARTRQELYDCLRKNDYGLAETYESQYVLIQYSDKGEEFTDLVYFMPFNDVFFESPCTLMSTEFEGDADQYVQMYVDDIYEFQESAENNGEEWYENRDNAIHYEKSMIRGNKHYQIENFQTMPYIQMPCTVIRIMGEQEALEYLINEVNASMHKESSQE